MHVIEEHLVLTQDGMHKLNWLYFFIVFTHTRLINSMISYLDAVTRNRDTVEPRSTDTRLIRTPGYCGQFCFSRRRKAHTFSLKLTRLIRTPVNTDTLACPLGVRINRVPLYCFHRL